MRDNDTDWFQIFLMVSITGLLILMLVTNEVVYNNGLQRGAKIALSSTDYLAEGIIGNCEDLFGGEECVNCHSVDFR